MKPCPPQEAGIQILTDAFCFDFPRSNHGLNDMNIGNCFEYGTIFLIYKLLIRLFLSPRFGHEWKYHAVSNTATIDRFEVSFTTL
jgi:hypothetical protein